MSGKHLSHDDFFEKLGGLFNHRKGSDHGAIYLSQKRLTYDAEDTPVPPADDAFPDLKQEAPLPIIVRASNGEGKRDPKNRVRLSTVVKPDELDAFYARYADVCKAGMTALKPRDRSKKKAKAKRKKVAA